MNKEELHQFIKEKQPNICQVVAYKDNKKVAVLRNMQKINNVSRLIFRTKPQRKAPGPDTRPTMPDIPDTDKPKDERIYMIRYVSTEKIN